MQLLHSLASYGEAEWAALTLLIDGSPYALGNFEDLVQCSSTCTLSEAEVHASIQELHYRHNITPSNSLFNDMRSESAVRLTNGMLCYQHRIKGNDALTSLLLAKTTNETKGSTALLSVACYHPTRRISERIRDFADTVSNSSLKPESINRGAMRALLSNFFLVPRELQVIPISSIVMSTSDSIKKSSTRKVTAQTSSSLDLLELDTGQQARQQTDHIAILSLSEAGTHLKPFPQTGQQQVLIDALAGNSRFKKKKKAAVLDTNFDCKVVGTESTLQSPGLPRISKPIASHSSGSGHSPLKFSSLKSSSLKSNRRDTSTKSKPKKMQVNIALNEDLACSYQQSQLASCVVEGVVQLQTKGSECVPFGLWIRDAARHVNSLHENRRFATIQEQRDADTRLDVQIPKLDEYFPVVKYKCSPDLRPVPIRVQTRIKAEGALCRVALQISSNPNNSSSLTDLTIFLAVPPEIDGSTVETQPTGGVWDARKQAVIWCVSELEGGEKFQLQAKFALGRRSEVPQMFPVSVRCQCLFAQLSDVELEVCEGQTPVDLTMKVARRFRLSHKEK